MGYRLKYLERNFILEYYDNKTRSFILDRFGITSKIIRQDKLELLKSNSPTNINIYWIII